MHGRHQGAGGQVGGSLPQRLAGLADDCTRDDVYEFMLVAFMLVAPHLPITGDSGTPVGALALK